MSIIRTLFIVVLCVLTPTLSYAQTGTEKLEHFLKTVHTFQADFKQVVLGEKNAQVLDQSEGTFLLLKPGKFRWNYTKPYKQQIIADGHKLWFYDEDLEQVTVKSQKAALNNTPAILLAGGNTHITDQYNISNMPSKDGLQWVRLLPKSKNAGFQSVILIFDGKGLNKMIMRDNFGRLTRLIFSNVKVNETIASEHFIFVPPKGVDVMKE